MREKGFFLRHFTARALKSAAFSALCSVPAIRQYLNYYQEAESFQNAAERESLRTLKIRPIPDYAIAFSEGERREILRCDAGELEALILTYKMARVRDVTILGSSGVSVGSRSGRVLHLDAARSRMHPNWVVARPLKEVPSDESATYINLLGVRRGHRHFAHFFWDAMVPLIVYLKNWHDPAEQVVCLVREDLSPIQRDAFRFLAEDHPGISFETLGAGEKMRCRNTIYLAYQNPNHGRDNTMARDYLLAVADLFRRHYGIRSPDPGERKRIYVSRADAVLRRVRNEDAIVDMLARYGFERYEMSGLSFKEQAALFSSAEAIVTPHGAALANLMFCAPGTGVLEFFPSNYIDDGFARLGRSVGTDYHYLIGGEGRPPKLSYVMDVEQLEQEVRSMLGNRPAAAETVKKATR